MGVLRAGGAYVPLDPRYPVERLKWMIDNSASYIVVTRSEEKKKCLCDSAATVCLDHRLELNNPNAALPSLSMAAGTDTAYVIYTSGSTGQSKGVLVTRSNLANSIAARHHFYGEVPSRYLLLSSVSFDSSVAGIFWTLSSGGVLVLPEEKLQQYPNMVAALIKQTQVSHLLCLPSLYSMILDHSDARDLESLRTVIVAGEICAGPVPDDAPRSGPLGQALQPVRANRNNCVEHGLRL